LFFLIALKRKSGLNNRYKFYELNYIVLLCSYNLIGFYVSVYKNNKIIKSIKTPIYYTIDQS